MHEGGHSEYIPYTGGVLVHKVLVWRISGDIILIATYAFRVFVRHVYGIRVDYLGLHLVI